MTYTILTRIKIYTTGISHIQPDAEGKSKTLCGKELGFDYEGHEDNITGRIYNFMGKDEILSLNFCFCKVCYNRLKHE